MNNEDEINSSLEVYKLNISVKNRMKNMKTALQLLIYSLIVAKIENNLKLAEVKDDNLIFKISKREILEELNLVKLQSNFKEQIADLTSLKIEHYYKDINDFRFINIFSYIDYSNNYLTAKINQDIISYFIDFEDGSYLKYHFKYLVKFKSKYTMLLYELLKSDYYKIKRDYHFDYDYSFLLQQLQVESPSMKQFFNFRIKILEKSLAEINLKTDINIKYKKILNGKTVYKIRFLPLKKVNKTSAIKKEEELPISEKKELEKLRRYKKNNSKKHIIYDNEYWDEFSQKAYEQDVTHEMKQLELSDIPF